jgi:hypothetical protein
MKLEISDFKYLGIDVLRYSDEEIKLLKDNLEVDDLIKELFNEENLLPVPISSADIGDHKYKIYEDISTGLHNNVITLFNIICKLRFIEDEVTAINAYKLILEGMIELREKGINVLHKELNPFKDGEFIDAEFIERYYLYPEILEVLKNRNIKRLKQLFEERDNLTKTEKRQELQQFLTRFIELIDNAPDEIYEDYSTLTFYNRLNSLAKEYKKYEADNCERVKNE